jgi:hypothetical protein
MPTMGWLALLLSAVLVIAALAHHSDARRVHAALSEVARRRGGTVTRGRLGALPSLRIEIGGAGYLLGAHPGASEAASPFSLSFVDASLDPPPTCAFTLAPRSVQGRLDTALLGGAISIADPRLGDYDLRGTDERAVREALPAGVRERLLAPPTGHRLHVRVGRSKRFENGAWSEPVVLSVAVEPMSAEPAVYEWLLDQAQALARTLSRG